LDRFEVGQQYAWEWSLKINSINEEDSGLYLCKVGSQIIKQYEIIVRVPPRIKDDITFMTPERPAEGDKVQLSCFASGTPTPSINWYIIMNDDSLKLLPDHTGNYLTINKTDKQTPRRYQCRASNNIPPSDTRNFTINLQCKIY
jgi:hypothetical protein